MRRRTLFALALPLTLVACLDLGKDRDDDDDDDDGGDEATNPYADAYEEGGYNIGNCTEFPTATEPSGENNGYANTWAVGDVVEDFALMDQYGQEVHLYAFCGQNIMLAFGASWCGPCQEVAATVQAHQDEYGPEGFQAIEILIQNVNSQPPTQDDLVDWATSYGLETVPVLDDGAQAVWPYYELDWGIPTLVHIGPDMTVLSVDDYIYDPGVFIE